MKEESIEYILEYTEQFIEDVEAYKKTGQKSILSKINSLIDEIQHHPTTGTGKPEALRGDRKGQLIWAFRLCRRALRCNLFDAQKGFILQSLTHSSLFQREL